MNKYIKHIVEAFDFSSIKQQNTYDRINDNIKKMYINVISGVLNHTIKSSKDIEPYIKEMFNNAVAIYKPKDKEEFKKLIKRWPKVFGNKCSFNWIDTSEITDMKDLFKKSKFNGDISQWDVSNVTNMHAMFGESKFNGDISNWNVSNVTEMNHMFYISEFDGDISKWDVSNVTDMNSLFWKSKFNGDISQWNVSKVSDMRWMFEGSKFNGDISNWDVSNVKYYLDMFKFCPIKDEYKPHFK